MGHRANYILRRGGRTQLFHSHWGALSLAQDIFWGPDETSRFIRSLRATDELLDDDSCGGTALVDWDAQRLVWFEDDHLVQEPVQRRLYARLLQQTWPDWEIRYAADGILTIADYLEIDRPTVQIQESESAADDEWVEDDAIEDGADELDTELADDLELDLRPAPRPASDGEEGTAPEPGAWLAVRLGNGVLADYFGFDDLPLDDALLWGPPLIDLLPGDARTGIPPETAVLAGAVIDAAARRLGYWDLGADFARRVQQAWAGWHVEELAGGWEELLRWSGREVPDELRADERACLASLVTLLLDEDRWDPQVMLDSMQRAAREANAGCGCVATLVTVVAAAVAAWVRTPPVIAVCVLVALAFVIPAIRIRRRSARLVAMAEGSEDAPLPAGPSLPKKRSILDQALGRLGYPTTEQFEQAGQLTFAADGQVLDNDLPDRFGPLRPLRADEIAGVDFYQLRLNKLRFRELRRGTTLWQACLIKFLAPLGWGSGPTLPVPRASRLIWLVWEDLPQHVRRCLEPWLRQAAESGFTAAFYYTLPMLGRQEAFSVVLHDAESLILASFLYARVRVRMSADDEAHSDEAMFEASLLSVLPNDTLLVTGTRSGELDPLPGHDVQSWEDADWPTLLAAHRRRLESRARSVPRPVTAAELPALVLRWNQQEIDHHAARGVYERMSREDIDRFAEEG